MPAPTVFSRIKDNLSVERLFILIFLLTLFLRFFALDLKLFHHDEAIHAWFSYEILTGGNYTYDPMYHGPFLYYATTAMFSLFGDTDLVGRVLPALFGSLLVPLVYAIYRLKYLDGKAALVAALFIALSPDMVYFSRFLRHDIFQIFFTLLLVAAVLAWIERRTIIYALVAGLAIGCGMSCKEDMPILLVIFGLFFIWMVWKKRIILPPTWKRDVVAGAIVAIAVIFFFYSSLGTHPEVVSDAGQRAITHWTSMHEECRLCGPWFFYILLLLIYEIPIFALALFGTGEFLYRNAKVRELTGSLAARFRKSGPAGDNSPVVDPVTEIKPIQTSIDRPELFMQFCLWWMVLSMAVYGYIGEKVPWLLIHQLLPLIFVAVYRMNTWKVIYSAAAVIFLAGMVWHVAFVPVDISDPIVQVQNSEDMRMVMDLIDASDTVVIASKNYWPLPWYYRGDRWDKMVFYGQITDEETIYEQDADLVITHDEDSYETLSGYEKRRYKLDYWFSEYDQRDRYLDWYLLRDGKVGSMNFDVFVRTRGTEEFSNQTGEGLPPEMMEFMPAPAQNPSGA